MILAAIALQLASAPLSLGSSPAVPNSVTHLVAVPSETPVRLVTLAPISSRAVRQGQRFELRVDEDVAVGGEVVIPRGTPAVGEVEAVSGTGMFGKPGRLVLQPLFIDIAGQRVNLAGISRDRGHDATAAAAVTTVLVGALGLVITGKSATLPAGTVLFGRVRTDVSLPAGAPSGPTMPASADR